MPYDVEKYVEIWIKVDSNLIRPRNLVIGTFLLFGEASEPIIGEYRTINTTEVQIIYPQHDASPHV